MKVARHIERDARAPRYARELIDEFAGALGQEATAEAKLLVSEIVTNSVKYGDGTLKVLAELEGGSRLRCEVVDDGVGFTPRARSRPNTEVGGWGLFLVEALADSWGVADGSTHVWFELDLGR